MSVWCNLNWHFFSETVPVWRLEINACKMGKARKGYLQYQIRDKTSLLPKQDFKRKGGKFDISKIPDIYDCIKYDMLHNRYTNQTSRSCLTCSITP